MVPKVVLGLLLGPRQFNAKKEFVGISDVFEKSEVPTIASGLGLSWVMVPLGRWSLERGRGDPAENWSRPVLETGWRMDITLNALLFSSYINLSLQ